MATKKKETPGQKLIGILFRAEAYAQEGEKMIVLPGVPRGNPQRATKKWMSGMSRSLKEKFPGELRKQRENLSLTQQELADLAELTGTAVAMIERGERVPNLDTAARLCWALDVAAGVTLEELA